MSGRDDVKKIPKSWISSHIIANICIYVCIQALLLQFKGTLQTILTTVIIIIGCLFWCALAIDWIFSITGELLLFLGQSLYLQEISWECLETCELFKQTNLTLTLLKGARDVDFVAGTLNIIKDELQR